MERFRIGKVFITCTNPQGADEQISKAAVAKIGGYICVSNLRMIMYAGEHEDYARLMDKSFMNLPDGTPLAWLGHLWGLKNVAVTNGPGVFHRLLSNGDTGLKHYLLGDTQEVVDAIIEKYSKEYGTCFAGGSTLPFADVDDFDYEGIASEVKESGANIIWTAMRAPKQDEFNARLSKYLPDVVMVGVGRAFRISIGEVTMASTWAQKAGIGGFFIRKKGIMPTLWWYLKASSHLVGYSIQIIWRRLTGHNSNE